MGFQDPELKAIKSEAQSFYDCVNSDEASVVDYRSFLLVSVTNFQLLF